MTTDELDIAALDELGETQSNASLDSSAIRYRILNRAYRHVCRNSWVTWRGAGTWTIAVGDETFDLASSSCLNLATGYDVLDVVRCYYLISGLTDRDLRKRQLAVIKAKRSITASPGTYPSLYSFYRYDSSGTKKAYLDIYGPATDAGSSVLFADWLEDPPDLSSSQDPVTPTYADDCIALFFAAYMARAMPSALYAELMQSAKGELRSIRAKSFKETSGEFQSRFAH